MAATRPDAPLVSVLTPVHNGAAHIEECIASVLRQTYPSWTYTVVDNASTDGTPELVERRAREDPRVRLLRFEEHVDANENHNRAFACLEPEAVYCKIVQADDWLYPDCLERMVETAESADAIGVVGAFWLREARVEGVGMPDWGARVSGLEVLRRALLGGPYVTGAPTATLLRADLVRRRQPFWGLDLWHSDTEALYWLLTQSDFGYVRQVLTFSRRQPGARSALSTRINTYGPENILFLLRYGPGVLEPADYRRRLRFELRRYLSWHLRQAAKPSRAADAIFFDYHRRVIGQVEREAADEPMVRGAMSVVRALLARERFTSRLVWSVGRPRIGAPK